MEHHSSLLADPRTWVGVAFTIFFLIFGKKLAQIVAGILDKRANDVRLELAAASALRTEAEAMLRDATAQRDAALIEAKAMLVQARGESARVAEAARTDAVTAARRREQTAIDRIAAAEKAAITDVRLAAVNIATRAAQHVLSQSFGADADAALIDHAIAGLPTALAGRRAA